MRYANLALIDSKLLDNKIDENQSQISASQKQQFISSIATISSYTFFLFFLEPLDDLISVHNDIDKPP